MIKYFVRTTDQRTFNYDLNYEKLVDYKHEPIHSFIEQLKYISSHNSVLLEDDLILCKDFQTKIEDVIKQYPNKVINFFESPQSFFFTEEREGKLFAYNQCTYYPKGKAKLIAETMEQVCKLRPDLDQYDLIEREALHRLNETYIAFRPCLVQHLDKDSLIGNLACGYRKSFYFIDYLNELNIDYKEANTKENYKKLRRFCYLPLSESL